MVKHIPSFLTLFNIACGFLAISVNHLLYSSILIMICLFLDFADGAAARLLKAQSDLGAELDSLADLVSFGIAPAYLYFTLVPFGGWQAYVPAIFIVVGGALRLAIFNLLPSSKYFKGLAIPANAYFIMGILLAVHFQSEIMIAIVENKLAYFLIPIFLAYMMLSPLEMFSLKEVQLGPSKNVFQLICLAQFIILLFVLPKLALCLSVIGYIILSVIESQMRKAKA